MLAVDDIAQIFLNGKGMGEVSGLRELVTCRVN